MCEICSIGELGRCAVGERRPLNVFDSFRFSARSAKPCVLFFDEFDSLAPRRGHDSTGVTDRVVNQLLTELDGVEGLQGVVVIAATSRPELLDPALLRSGRIDRLVQCALPNRAARLKIFETLAKVSALKLDQTVDFKQFCNEKSDNYTGADLKSILVSANMIAVKQCLAKCGEVSFTCFIQLSTNLQRSKLSLHLFALFRMFPMRSTSAKSI